MAYYAWSEIKAGDKSAKPGDTVSASDLGLSKEQFEELVEAGAVKEEKFPDPGDFPGSPVEHAKKDLAIAAGHIEPDEVDGIGVAEKPKGDK